MDLNFFKQTRILDGGMGQELLARGMKPSGTLWSASALLNKKHHQLILETHLDFINAGADEINHEGTIIPAYSSIAPDGSVLDISAISAVFCISEHTCGDHDVIAPANMFSHRLCSLSLCLGHVSATQDPVHCEGHEIQEPLYLEFSRYASYKI